MPPSTATGASPDDGHPDTSSDLEENETASVHRDDRHERSLHRASEPEMFAHGLNGSRPSSMNTSGDQVDASFRSGVSTSTGISTVASNREILSLAKELDDRDKHAKRRARETKQTTNATTLSVPPLQKETVAPKSGTAVGLARRLPDKFGSSASSASSNTTGRSWTSNRRGGTNTYSNTVPQPPSQGQASLPGAYNSFRRSTDSDRHTDGPDIGTSDNPTTAPETPMIEATLVPQNSESVIVSGDAPVADQEMNNHPQVQAIEADKVELRELLQHRKLQWFIFGLVACIVIMVVIVVLVVVSQTGANDVAIIDALTNSSLPPEDESDTISSMMPSPPAEALSLPPNISIPSNVELSWLPTDAPTLSPSSKAPSLSLTPSAPTVAPTPRPTSTPSMTPTFLPTVSSQPSYSKGYTLAQVMYSQKLNVTWVDVWNPQYLTTDQQEIMGRVFGNYTVHIAGGDARVLSTTWSLGNERIEFLDADTPYLELTYLMLWESCHAEVTQLPDLFLEYQRANQDRMSSDLQAEGFQASWFGEVGITEDPLYDFCVHALLISNNCRGLDNPRGTLLVL